MATGQPEDDKLPSPSVSTPVSAPRNTKFHQTDSRNSKIYTEEVTNTEHNPNTNQSITNLSGDKSDYKTHKQSVTSLIAAIETSGKSSAPPITPRKTSAREFQPYGSLKRKSALVTDAIPGQDQDLTATLPKPNNTTGTFYGTPPPLQPKGANLSIPPPRPYSATETTKNLLPKQDCDISFKIDFSKGCDFCGKPDDDDIDAAVCKVCQQNFCLVCLESHQKCNSTKDHEITYKLGPLPDTNDDEMSTVRMSDEYISLAADTHKCDQGSEKETSGSNSTESLFCELCVDPVYMQEIVAFCKECSTKMCIKCLAVHQQDKNKQHHNIDNIQQIKNSEWNQFLNKIKCKLHPEWRREYFCTIHTEIICIKCRVDERHEDCTESIVELQHGSLEQNIDKRATDRKVVELTCLSNEVSRIKDTVHASLEELGVKKTDFKEKLKQQQIGMVSQLNLAVTILDDHLELLKHKKTDNQNIKCLLQRQISEFEDLLKSGSEEKIFIKQTSIETAVQKFGIILKELQSPVDSCYKVTENSEVDGLLKEFEDAKEMIFKERLTTQRPFIDLEAVLTNEVSLYNFKTTCVVGMEMLPDETLLICNKSTEEIIMLNNEFKLNSALKLDSAPTSMAVFSNGSIIVALPTEKCLQHVNAGSKQALSVVKKVKTKLPCLQISPFKKNMVAVVKDVLCNCIVLSDTDGAICSSIFNDKGGMLQDILCMTTNQDHNIIYIMEQNQGCIGISMKGDIVFEYKSDSIQVYKGICTDYCGNVYLAEKNADNVVVVNNNGEKVKDIFTVQGLQPEFMKFNHTCSKLVILSFGMTNKIRVFTLI